MFSLSKESENDLVTGLLELVNGNLAERQDIRQNLTGLITPKQLREDLELSQGTLDRWEKAGLKRYQPPVEDTRKVFYRVSDVLVFLGVENGE